MTTLTRNAPQLRFGETQLEDAHLLELLEQREAAKVAYEDAKGYLDDYVDQRAFLEGEYRCGPFRVRFGSRRTLSISVPKK